ncbi:GtrA family protein [Ilumatobacter sp.]|uniref:GtrA family protein n=1 Tax=Ilumatobacter sp. TaxID=1967498 RepID=UPI0037511D7F
MSLHPTECPPHATRQKLGRYTVVTLIATPTNFVLFTFLLTVLQLPAVAANLIAAACITIPTFVAYRRWVWPANDTASTASEVGMYWLWTTISIALASGVLWSLERSGASHPVLILTPLLTYATLWIARFSFLDRYLFAQTADVAALNPIVDPNARVRSQQPAR